MTSHRGIRNTAIAYILIPGSGTVIILFHFADVRSGLPAHLHHAFALAFLMNLAGLAAGIGFLFSKNWARLIALIYSFMVSIFGLFNVFLFIVAAVFHGRNIGAVLFFTVFIFPLPVWSLYYLTRPRIKEVFVPRRGDKGDKPEAAPAT